RSAEVYSLTKRSDEFGVVTNTTTLDFAKVQSRKTAIVEKLYQGVQYLMKQGKIDIYNGFGRILGPSIFSPVPGTISVELEDGQENEMLIPKNVIIATGSKPRSLPGLHIDGSTVITSDEALEMENLPKSMLIVGGGVIGIEWASMLADFGVDVTVVEYANRIIPTEDVEISKELERLLHKKGIRIITNAKILPETFTKNEESVTISAEKNETLQSFTVDRILVSIGREGNIENIGLQNTDIITDNGYIQVNAHYQTKESHIYAIGDVIGGLQLAHVASHEGIRAVEHIAGTKTEPLRYEHISKCVYSHPEVASIGYTEEEARQRGYEIKMGKFPFQATGKALVFGESDGFVKVIADKKTNDILGVHMIGPNVTDMISEAG